MKLFKEALNWSAAEPCRCFDKLEPRMVGFFL
jgi:hypothetical protein